MTIDVMQLARKAGMEEASKGNLFYAGKEDLERFAALVAGGQAADARTCTCHPDDNPPKPCPRKFALNECRAAAGVKGHDE